MKPTHDAWKKVKHTLQLANPREGLTVEVLPTITGITFLALISRGESVIDTKQFNDVESAMEYCEENYEALENS